MAARVNSRDNIFSSITTRSDLFTSSMYLSTYNLLGVTHSAGAKGKGIRGERYQFDIYSFAYTFIIAGNLNPHPSVYNEEMQIYTTTIVRQMCVSNSAQDRLLPNSPPSYSLD